MNAKERNEILKLLAEGKITTSDAIRMLDENGGDLDFGENMKPPAAEVVRDISESLNKENKAGVPDESDPFKIKISEDDILPGSADGQPRWLKIRVRNMETGRNKVIVSLPLGLVGFGLGVARRFGAEFDDQGNIEQIWQMIKGGEAGTLIDVEDEEDNEHIQIYLA